MLFLLMEKKKKKRKDAINSYGQIDVSMLLTDTISEKSPYFPFVILNVLVPLPRTIILKAVYLLLFLLSDTLCLSFSFLF